MNSNMAALTAIAIGFALIADLFLLPTLLLFTDRAQPVREPALATVPATTRQ